MTLPLNTTLLLSLASVACMAACRAREPGSQARDSATSPGAPALTAARADTWSVSRLTVAPARFRPGAWSDEHVLWGLVRGRLTRLDTRDGTTRTLPSMAWWIRSAPNVVVWQNERGTWRLHDDTAARPMRLAGPDGDPNRSGDGPTVLLSPDGNRAVIGWQHEWDAIHDLLEPNGSTRRLQTRISGFYLNSATLWLDSTRILFQIVATGPRGGEPTYRESGWRAPLAVYDLRTGDYRIVVDAPELTRLRVAGPYRDGVLVTEWDTTGVRGHWVYDTKTWQRRAISLPKGRAFSSKSGAVVLFPDVSADTTDAVLYWDGMSKSIGRVARDAEPAFSPFGNRGAVHTAGGVMLLEARRATP